MPIYNGTLASGWANYSWATVNFSNTSPVYGTPYSIKVQDSSGYQALYLHHTEFSSSPYVNLSFWIYPTVAGTNEISVAATVNSQAQTTVQISFTSAQINQWQQVTIPLSLLGANDNANFDGFWIQNILSSANTFYVDEIGLSNAPPSPVTVTVDAASFQQTIDDRIYGMNTATWDYTLNTPVTESLFEEMNIRVIRLPGGSSGDAYNWQTYGGPYSGANTSTFAQMASAIGAQEFAIVNYGSGTPQQAAAWVAYYNGSPTNTLSLGTDSMGRNWQTVGYWASIRAAAPLATDDGYNFLRASHPAPYGFKYYEVGNELYGSWENDQHGVSGSGLTGVAHDPYTYAQSFQVFNSMMKAVDPTIKVGAVAAEGEDSWGNGTHGVANPYENNSIHTGWTPVVLANLKTEGVVPDFLIDHLYPQGPGNETDAGLLQASARIGSDASNIRQMITDYYGGYSASQIELNMTEYNSVTGNPGKQTVSLVNALFLADSLGYMTNTEFNTCTWFSSINGAYTGGNNSSSLYGWRRTFGDYGVIADGDPGMAQNTPFPTFYAEKLMTHWGRGGDSVISTTSSYGLVSAYAAKLANGNLALLLINKHPNSVVNAQITLNNFGLGSTVATVYSYGETNDTNQTDLTTSSLNISGSTFTYTMQPYSMQVMVLPPPHSVISAPTAFILPGNTANHLTWSSVSGAATYTVERAPISVGPYMTIASGQTGTAYTDWNLTNGTPYYYLIIAANSSGSQSPPSNEVAGTPIYWTDQDIGSPSPAGSLSLVNSVIGNNLLTTAQIQASGSDIWGTSDQFNYSWRPWTGNGVLIAHVNSLANTNAWAKAGVMFRDTLGATAAEISLVDSYSSGVSFQGRALTGAASTFSATSGSAPVWVKLTRSGSTYTAYQSPNGVNWTSVGAALTPTFSGTSNYAGLAVTSHLSGTLTTAVFDRFAFLVTPSSLASPSALANSVVLVWQGNSNNDPWDATAAQVEVSPTGANTWTVVTSDLPPSTTSCTAAGLASNTAYDFRVKYVANGISGDYATLTNVRTK